MTLWVVKQKEGFLFQNFYSLNASIDPIEATSELQQKRVNSVYGKASLSWASTYFLDVTGRNDWSSTLSSDQRSYFYPSVSGSIVLSEIVKLPTWWDFLKVRASWTTAKEDAKIYANNNVYSVSTNVWDGLQQRLIHPVRSVDKYVQRNRKYGKSEQPLTCLRTVIPWLFLLS